MKPLSLTARISLLFAGAAAIVLLAVGWVLARAVEAHFVDEDRHEIHGKFELIGNLLGKAHEQNQFDALAQQLDDALVGHHGLSVTIVDDRGAVWFASSGAPYPKALLASAPAPAEQLILWDEAGRSYRGQTRTLPAGPAARPYRVAIALDITHHQVFMAEFRRLLAFALLLAVLATAGLGWVATRRGLIPLRDMTRMASSLSANRLTERLQSAGTPAELQTLVQAFNAMLDRLEDAFQRLSHFSSDLAHELRTPISNLRTQTEVALSRARSAEEYRDTLQSNLEEYEKLARMISDMLFLAQADNRLIVPRREPIDLAHEARRLAEFYEALATEQGVVLAVEGMARCTGDRLMLQRALSNLLANAIRHTAPGGTVRLALSERAGQAEVAIENPGPAIPPEHLPHLFDRFYQVDPARRQGEHAGLGLAITKSIVEAHGGSIEVQSEAGLTRFRLRLPEAA